MRPTVVGTTEHRSSRGAEGTARRSPGNRTTQPRCAVTVPTPARGIASPGQMRKDSAHVYRCHSHRVAHRDHPRWSRSRPRPPPVLPRVRRDRAARPVLRLRRVLRPARGGLRVRRRHPGLDRGRPAEHLALPGPAAGPVDRARHPEPRAGLHPAGSCAQPGPRAGHARAVGQGRQRQPDPLVQGPGRRRRAGCGPRARLHHAGLSVDRQPRQRGRGGRRPGRDPLGGAGPGRPRAAEDRHHRRVRRRRWSRSRGPTTTSTGSPPSWPATTRTGRS